MTDGFWLTGGWFVWEGDEEIVGLFDREGDDKTDRFRLNEGLLDWEGDGEMVGLFDRDGEKETDGIRLIQGLLDWEGDNNIVGFRVGWLSFLEDAPGFMTGVPFILPLYRSMTPLMMYKIEQCLVPYGRYDLYYYRYVCTIQITLSYLL